MTSGRSNSNNELYVICIKAGMMACTGGGKERGAAGGGGGWWRRGF